MLDLSIDRHYEFDAARTPTDDIWLSEANQPLLLLPHSWNRPYLGYNPRRDKELGAAAAAARQERVFSDSEIYSPVFPRGRPEPGVDISARVQAMKKEFAEYREQQKIQQQKQLSSENPEKPSSAPESKKSSPVSETTSLSAQQLKEAADRLESLI